MNTVKVADLEKNPERIVTIIWVFRRGPSLKVTLPFCRAVEGVKAFWNSMKDGSRGNYFTEVDTSDELMTWCVRLDDVAGVKILEDDLP